MKSVEMSFLRTLFFYGISSTLLLACSSQSNDDENKQAASCLLDSTSQKSCWGFTDKSTEVIELVKAKCEDGTGFGSEGTFAYDQCEISQNIGSCIVVLEDYGEGTLYFFPQWGQSESADICSDVSGTYSDASEMSIARTSN